MTEADQRIEEIIAEHRLAEWAAGMVRIHADGHPQEAERLAIKYAALGPAAIVTAKAASR